MKNNWKRWLIFPALLPFFSWMEAKTLEENQIQQSLDTIEYRVFVAVDKAGVEHWGGKEAYQAKLNAFFDQVNDFWNKAGNGRFNYYFRYIPDLQVIYDCSSRQLEKIYQKSAGFPNHDVLLIIDSILDFDDEESAKGWYCGGGADDLNMVICRSRSKTEHDFEGVHGLEEMKWAEPGTDQVIYDVTAPFIRMVAGPLDYTQGAMNNVIMKNFHAVYTEPMSQGTRCRQLALYTIFDSPINMLCDAPTNYLKEEECTKFIAAIPTVWNQTLPISGKVGEHIVMAREKDGIWYVGGLTDWKERDVEVDLSFLGDGEFNAEIFRDGINADRVGKDYKREVIRVSANKKLNLHMAPGGGFVVRITK